MATSAPGLPSNTDRTAVAPWWHTILLILAILAYGVPELYRQPILLGEGFQHRHLAVYTLQVLLKLSVLAYVWFGLRLAGKDLRNLVGRQWSRATDALRDIGIAFLLRLAVIVMLLAMHVILKDSTGGVRVLKKLLPHGAGEMIGWIAVSATAGFCEEVIFRGYLQRQFLALTGRTDVAVLLQAVLFGSVHLYQGVRGAITIAVYGVLFGIVAVRAKSLRLGMIQHAAEDTFVGIVGALLMKYHYL